MSALRRARVLWWPWSWAWDSLATCTHWPALGPAQLLAVCLPGDERLGLEEALPGYRRGPERKQMRAGLLTVPGASGRLPGGGGARAEGCGPGEGYSSGQRWFASEPLLRVCVSLAVFVSLGLWSPQSAPVATDRLPLHLNTSAIQRRALVLQCDLPFTGHFRRHPAPDSGPVPRFWVGVNVGNAVHPTRQHPSSAFDNGGYGSPSHPHVRGEETGPKPCSPSRETPGRRPEDAAAFLAFIIVGNMIVFFWRF